MGNTKSEKHGFPHAEKNLLLVGKVFGQSEDEYRKNAEID